MTILSVARTNLWLCLLFILLRTIPRKDLGEEQADHLDARLTIIGTLQIIPLLVMTSRWASLQVETPIYYCIGTALLSRETILLCRVRWREIGMLKFSYQQCLEFQSDEELTNYQLGSLFRVFKQLRVHGCGLPTKTREINHHCLDSSGFFRSKGFHMSNRYNFNSEQKAQIWFHFVGLSCWQQKINFAWLLPLPCWLGWDLCEFGFKEDFCYPRS